jgi:hypothetical protein
VGATAAALSLDVQQVLAEAEVDRQAAVGARLVLVRRRSADPGGELAGRLNHKTWA